MDKNTKKKPINMRALKSGSYSLVVSAVALALVVVVNLLVGALPSTYTKMDFSTVGVLNISEETEGIVSAIDIPVKMYLVAPRGSEDTTIMELLQRYKALSPHITVETVDPDTNPGFVSNYTTDTVSMNSVIVASELRSYVVDNSQIYLVSYENMTQEDYYNYVYYGIEPTGTPYFYGELLLTTAVDYVTSSVIPTVYSLMNHGEDAFSESIATTISANNIISAELGLLSVDAIPEDCSAIIINNPKTDISVYEAEMLQSYLQAGGNMILLTDFRYYSEEKMPNLAALTALMGMRAEDGIVVEADRSYYNGYPTTLLPTVGIGGPATMLSSQNMYTLVPNAHGIVLTGEGDATATELLKTSTSAYVKKAGQNLTTYEKEEGDAEGQFAVAASATLDTGKFVWYSSPYILNEEMDYYVNGGNSTMFITSVNWMCEKTVSVSVVAKTMQVEALVIPESASNAWSLILTVLLPVAVLGGGFVIWFRRRRR